MRGRNNNNNNNRKGPNPLTRNYESNGPDVKIRGSAQQIAEKYATLARDAQSAGDRVMAENYLQHAEHYYRILMAQGAQLQNQQQQFAQQGGQPNGNGNGNGNGDGRPMQGNGTGNGNGNEGYHQPPQQVRAGSAPSFSLADGDDKDDGDDAG